ncbi:TPA: hypothetical protein ACH3X1_015419 [Trebouxia sp. C0004]
MSISRDVIFDEDVKQQHTPVTSESVPIPGTDSDELPATVKEEAVAAKEEAAPAPEVVAKGAAEEERQETAVAATEHRYVRDHHLNAVSKAGSAKELWDLFKSTYMAKSNTRFKTLLHNLLKQASNWIDRTYKVLVTTRLDC